MLNLHKQMFAKVKSTEMPTMLLHILDKKKVTTMRWFDRNEDILRDTYISESDYQIIESMDAKDLMLAEGKGTSQRKYSSPERIYNFSDHIIEFQIMIEEWWIGPHLGWTA